MADESFVENLIDGFAVVDGSLRLAHYAGAGSSGHELNS
jgi:hypothetical protein